MERDQTIMRIGSIRRGSAFARLWRWFKQARENPHARRARRVILMLVLLWIVSAFDLVFTLMAVKTGTFVEANPLAAPLMNDPVLLATFKILIVVMASIIIFRFRKRLFTEVGCWGLCLTYTMLSARWCIYFFQHH